MKTEFDYSDIQILKCIKSGRTIKEVAAIVHKSKPAVEKRLRKMRINTGAQNSIHLITIAMDRGII